MSNLEKAVVQPEKYVPAAPSGEQEMISKAQHGDHDAFQSLYLKYKTYVASQCRRLGCGPELTEDLTQEVFVQLWKTISQFRGNSAFRTWLHRMTVNKVFGYFRKNTRENGRVEFSCESENIDLSDWVATPCSLDDRVLISEIMSSVPSGDRVILKLYTAGYRHEEIARFLGLSTATSRSQLYRARMKIQKDRPMFRHRAVPCAF